MIDATDASSTGGWITNGAGYHFNNNYGFGLVDVDALTRAATEFTGVTPLQTQTTGLISVGATIPENNAAGISRSVSIAEGGLLEEVQIRLRINKNQNFFSYVEDIKGVLTSPSGTQSVFLTPALCNCSLASPESGTVNLDWTYTSNAFWGEDPSGEWTVTLIDVPSPSGGSHDSYAMPWHSFEIISRSGSLISASPGDFDADGDVDGRDFLVWQRDSGQTARLRADDNNDGLVDAADLEIWQDNYGQGGTQALVAVPEPTSAGLAAIAITSFLGLNRRLALFSVVAG